MQAIFAFLKKNNLTSTEEQLKAELAKVQGGASAPTVQPNTEVGNVLAAYRSDDNPTSYEAAYSDLEVFVENSLDMYRHELALILYPVFVHMYLELVYNQNEASRMSRDNYTQLRQQKKHTLLWNVIQEHLYLDVYEGLPRSKSHTS